MDRLSVIITLVVITCWYLSYVKCIIIACIIICLFIICHNVHILKCMSCFQVYFMFHV